MSFRQDLPERSVQQSEINFRQAQKKRLLFRGAVFVYIPEKITRISTSCAFSAVPASAAREAVGAYQDGPADRDGHHGAASASASAEAVEADGHHGAASASASARGVAGGRHGAASASASARGVAGGRHGAASASASARVSQASASASAYQADSTDSDAAAAVSPAAPDGHPDDQAAADAAAVRKARLPQTEARLRRVQALKVSLRSSFPLN